MLTNEELAKRNKERDMQFNEQVIAPGEIVSSLPGTPKIEAPKIDQIAQNDKQIFGDFKPIEPINPVTTDFPEIKPIGKVETGMQTGTDVIPGFDSGSPILDKELKDIQTEKDKTIEDTKKSFLIGKAEFEKNKQYYTNYDEVNNLYTGVLDELTKSMDEYGVVSDARYSQIASKYGLTVDEVKNPNSILNRGNLSEEGKEKLGVNKFQSGIDDLETAKARKIADIERSLAQAQQQYDWQIEDVAKQLARNIGWTEAQGAWSGALRGSGYLQGIENIKKDGETTMNRLRTLSEQVKSASEEDLARVTEDYNKALGEAKKSLDTQLEDLKKNSILALSEAQATYGMGSDKLMKTLEKINEEYGLKSNQAVSAYLGNLKSMNDLANQNMNLVEKANQIETQKLDKQYKQYLENNGIVLQNTSLNTIATDLQNGLITIDRAKDLQNIMTSSIQATLGAIAPLTTQDLSTITQLLNQGLTPAEVIATMRQDERFSPSQKISPKDRFVNVGGKLYDMINESWVQEPGVSPISNGPGMSSVGFRDLTNDLQRPAGSKNVGQDTNNPGNIMAESPQGIEYAKSLGAIGFYKSPNGRTYAVFPDMQTGLEATKRDIESKLSGGSYWVTSNTTLGQLASGWTSGPNAPLNESAIKNFERLTGASRDTLISNIDKNTLIDAIVKNEGVDVNKGADLSYLAQTQRTGDYSIEEKAIMDTYLKNPASKQNIEALQMAGLTSDDITNYKTIEEGLGILGVPISYERGIKNMVPATLMNSEIELQQLNDTIKAMAKAGYSQEEAALTYMGFDVDAIKGENKMDFAMKLIDTMGSMGVNDDTFKTMVTRANNFMKRGEDGQAIKMLETEAQKKIKDIEGENFISDSRIDFSKQALDKLETFITKNSSKIGPLAGRFNKLSSKFKNDADFQSLQTLLEGSLAEVRRAFAGTAVTATELEAIRNFIGLNVNMPIENLRSALQTNFDQTLMNYNTQRRFVGIPEIPENMIGSSWNDRVKLYTGQTQTGTTPENTYNDKKVYTDIKEIKKDFLNY